MLDEGQEPQADREQANQAGDVVIAVEEERGEGEGLALQAAEATLDQVGVALEAWPERGLPAR